MKIIDLSGSFDKDLMSENGINNGQVTTFLARIASEMSPALGVLKPGFGYAFVAKNETEVSIVGVELEDGEDEE